MKIASAQIQLQSSHQSIQRSSISERLETWGADGVTRIATDQSGALAARAATTQVALSRQGRDAQAAEAAVTTETAGTGEGTSLDSLDARTRLIKSMIEMLTGRTIKLLDLRDIGAAQGSTAGTNEGAPARAAGGAGMAYEYNETYSEFEQVSFSAGGSIKTSDGQEIAFSLSFEMQRSFSTSTHVSITAGDQRLQDPLVLDFGGPAAALSNIRFSFDLDADGQLDDVPLLNGGSGFLAIDRNGNGRIDDGRELFGPTSGDGFAELAALDADGNGWIDEADPAFAQLRVWQPDAQGQGQLQTLAEAGVGALYLGKADTPFELRGNGNETLGVMRSSSVYVRENGTVGSVSQIDLSV